MGCQIALTSYLIRDVIGQIFRILYHILKPKFGETRLGSSAGCGTPKERLEEWLFFTPQYKTSSIFEDIILEFRTGIIVKLFRMSFVF